MSDFLTGKGLTIKRFTDVQDTLEQGLRSNVSPNLDLSVNSVAGQLNSVFGYEISEAWAYIEAVYNSFNIHSAQGVHLDNLVILGGIIRQGATNSNGVIYCSKSSVDNPTIPAGSTVSNLNGDLFSVDAPIAISKGATVDITLNLNNDIGNSSVSLSIDGIQFTQTYTVGAEDIAITALIAKINTDLQVGLYVDAVATSNPTEIRLRTEDSFYKQSMAITNSQEFSIVEVVSQGTVTAVETGIITASTNTVVNIESPISNWDSVRNPFDIIVGQEEETDDDLRERYFLSLSSGATATVEAIRADLLTVPDVINATILENDTGDFEPLPADPLQPAHSFQAIVEGGTDIAVAQSIWETKAAGVTTYGNTTINYTDSMGYNYNVHFTRPVNVPIFVQLSIPLAEKPNELQELAIKASILGYGDSLLAGADVIIQRITKAVYDIMPELTLVQTQIGKSLGTLDDSNIAIDLLETSVWDSANISFGDL